MPMAASTLAMAITIRSIPDLDLRILQSDHSSHLTRLSTYATGHYRYSNFETYVQDTWKVSPRLTLDYGIRFYWMQPQYDAGLATGSFQAALFDPTKAVRLYRPGIDALGNRVAVDPGTGATTSILNLAKIVPGSGDVSNGIGQAGKNVSKYLMDNQGIQFGPRVGVAWDVTGKHNFVFRAGGGIFYDRIQGNEVFDMLTNPPNNIGTNNCQRDTPEHQRQQPYTCAAVSIWF